MSNDGIVFDDVALDERGHDALKRLNAVTMEAEFHAPDLIHLDLSLIKDIKLGTILAMCNTVPNTEELFSYVNKNINKYRERIIDDPLLYFTELPFTKDDVAAYMADHSNHDTIFNVSPLTKFLDNTFINALISNIRDSKILNKKYYSKTENRKVAKDIVVHVNVHPIKGISALHIKAIAKYITERFAVSVMLINNDLTANINKLVQYDQYFIRDLSVWSSRDDFINAFTDFKMINKSMYAAKFVTDIPNIDTRKLEKGAALILNSYRTHMPRFNWISPDEISPETPKVEDANV